MNRMWWLHKLNMWEGLEPDKHIYKEECEALIRSSEYDENKIIYSSDLAGDTLYFIKEGKVKVFRNSTQNTEIEIAILSAGDAFGKLSMIEEGEKDLSIRSLSHAKINVLRQVQLEKLMKNHPAAAAFIVEKLKAKIEKKVDDFKSNLMKHTIKRLARLIHRMGKYYGDYITGNLPGACKRINYKVNPNELAHLLGVKKDIIDDMLETLTELELIEQQSGNIIIKSEKKLIKFIS